MDHAPRVHLVMMSSTGGRAELRRAVSIDDGRRACARCGFPLEWSGCVEAADGCRVDDPAAALAWLHGPPHAVADRLVLEAVSARAALLGDVAIGPPFRPARRAELQILSGPGEEVRITLRGPVASAASLAKLRTRWNGAPDWNRSFLNRALDLGVSQALGALARPAETGVAPTTAADDAETAEAHEEDEDKYDIQDLLADLENELPDAGVQALIYRPWLGRELAAASPDLARVAGATVAGAWHRLEGEIEQMLAAIAVLSAGAAARGTCEDAEVLLVQGWTVFGEYQSEQATSDWCLIGNRVAPLLQAWAMIDLGAFAFATLAACGWSITPSQDAQAGDTTELLCRPLPADLQPHRL